MTGFTESSNFPTANPLQGTYGGDPYTDVFVARLNASGSALVFSTYLGGSREDIGSALAVDPATGDALVTGLTASVNFPTANALQGTLRGGADAFVARLRASGSALVYSTYLGGSESDRGYALDVEPTTGDAFLTGETASTNFPTANPLQENYRGIIDAFVTRLRADGQALVFSTYLGGSDQDYGGALDVDPATGDLLITGETLSTNFPIANALQGSNRGNFDAFIARLRPDGRTLVYATYLGGNSADYGEDLAVDPATGDALLTGRTSSTDFPVANPLQGANRGNGDAYVVRLRADGAALVFSTYLGGSGEDRGSALAVHPVTGDVLLTGFTSSTNFPTANPLQGTNRGLYDAYVARLRADGAALVFSTYLGGSLDDASTDLAVEAATGDTFLTGGTNSVNFPTANPLQPGQNGGGVFRSTNGATNWSRRNSAGLPSGTLFSLIANPRESAVLYALDANSVVKSLDGGNSWVLQGNGLGNRDVESLVIDPITPSTLYAGTAYPSPVAILFKSTDGGANWNPSSGLTDLGVSALAIDPITPATLYAGAMRLACGGACTAYRIYKSTDGGNTWVPSSTGIPEERNYIGALAVDPARPSNVYASTRMGLYKSTNGGGTWTLSNTGLPGEVHLLTIAAPVPTSLQVVSKTSTLYATIQSRVYKSTNNGDTWTLSSAGLSTGLSKAGISALVISSADSATLYVSTTAGIYKSTNAAASWSRADTGVTNPNVTALAPAPSSPATLYASAASYGGSDAFVARISP